MTLIRHAPTRGNMQGKYIGRTNLPLCYEGRALARGQKGWPGVPRVYTSGMARSVQTAEILFPGAALVHEGGLAEMDFGDFEGRSWREMESDAAYRAWVDSGCEAPCPGGEAKTDFTARCCGAFLAVLEKEQAAGSQHVYMVAHGGTIMAVLSCLALPQQPYFSWKSAYCGGYLLAVEDAALQSGRPLRVAGVVEGVAL